MIKIKKKKENQTVLDWIPFKEVWNNFCYLEDGSVIGAIKVNCLNLHLMNIEEKEVKVEQFKKVLLGMDYPIKILSIDNPIDLTNNIESLKSLSKQESDINKSILIEEDINFAENIFSQNFIFNREFYIIIANETNDEKLLKQKINDIVLELNSIGLNSEMITSEDWRNLLFSLLNPTISLDVFRKTSNSINNSFKEKIAPAGLKWNERDIEVGDAYASIVTVNTYPSIVDVAWLSYISNINNTRMCMTITPIDSLEVSKNLRKSMSETKVKMMNVSDHADQIVLQNKLEDYEELANKIDRDNERMNLITINFFVYGETLEELNKNKKILKVVLNSANLNGVDLMFEQENGFKTFLPTMERPLEKDFGLPVPLTTVAASFPFVFERLQDEGASTIIGDDESGGLCMLDLWKRTNKRNNSNMTIVGKSGSGKSTFLKKLIRANYARGTKVIIIDPEREYKEFCEKVNGNWIDCGSGSSGIINPLEIRRSNDENEENRIDVSKHFQIFRTFVKYYYHDLTEYELTKLEEILITTYRKKGINFDTDISKLKPSDYPIMSDLYEDICDELKRVRQINNKDQMVTSLEKLCAITKRMVSGADSALWNGYSSIHIDSDFIVLDIHTLVDSYDTLLKTQFFNMLSWAWNEVSKNRNEQVLLVVDEAHLLIDPNNKDGIDFLKRTSKRIRKYNGSLIVSTQNMIDFTADEIKRYGQVIVDNSAYICLMAQGNKELDALKEMMKLSESETNHLATASRGDVLFVVSQDKRIPIKIYLREDEKELFGTGGGR
ncbi:MAG: ATP-binding protein [Bacilli bacterium]|nr:ATP-binding protein [Bacilli bacterium]